MSWVRYRHTTVFMPKKEPDMLAGCLGWFIIFLILGAVSR